MDVSKPFARDRAASPVHANLTLFSDLRDGEFLCRALAGLQHSDGPVLVSDSVALATVLRPARHVQYAEIVTSGGPVSLDQVQSRLHRIAGDASLLIVDMTGWLTSVQVAWHLDGWGEMCDRLCRDLGLSILSVYDTNLLIEDHFLAALRAHSHFLAPSGAYPNPYWIPPAIARSGRLTDQITHVLGEIVPDYREVDFRLSRDRDAATGADPRWVDQARRVQPRLTGGGGWRICCLGRLRIYGPEGDLLRWDIPGGATKKSKALFAYLLTRGDRGAPAQQLAELLWPGDAEEEVKRKRLHHAVAMLRRTLGGKDHVHRVGDYYVLNPPANTWVDLASFEQLCNRAKFLTEDGQDDQAMALLDAADLLYAGDLFEDLESDFVETEGDDWLLPRRVWLREMAMKVHVFKAAIHQRNGRLREALESCQAALAMDPLSEAANGMAMQIFHDQGRPQAVARQYRQYRSGLAQIDAGDDGSDLADLYRKLMSAT